MTALRKFAPERDGELDRIVDRINALTEQDLDTLGAWQDLSDLSSRTMFEAIDADPDSVVIDSEGNFEAVASVYVMLVYGPSKDEETMSDEYVATISGRLDANDVGIESARVDTSPFYN